MNSTKGFTNYRKINVVVDTSSWQKEAVPEDISAMAGTWSADVLLALIHTALWTRPPTVYGFHLSDFWACLRYYPAIAKSEWLRLRIDWESVDPHQKTILSDELGIGFTTSLLVEKLGCLEFTDTRYLVDILEPEDFSLKNSTKSGPKKAPDYVGRCSGSTYCVLECKGTQTSIKALNKAIKSGRDQKENLSAAKQVRMQHSLVAGLFIPKWTSSEDACIRISDPTWQQLENLLARRDTREIDTSIVQLALAASFSLAGLPEPARVLGTTPTRALKVLPDTARTAIKTRLGMHGVMPKVVFDSGNLISPGIDSEVSFPRLRFIVSPPAGLLQAIADASDVAHAIAELSESSRALEWKTMRSHSGADIAQSMVALNAENAYSSEAGKLADAAEVVTPLGFLLRIEVY